MDVKKLFKVILIILFILAFALVVGAISAFILSCIISGLTIPFHNDYAGYIIILAIGFIILIVNIYKEF